VSSIRWIKNVLLSVINNHIIDYPTAITITYLWSFGSLAGLSLVIQILTGVFLAMHYTPHVDLAFNSVEHIMRDVNNGWLLRYMHSNGASMFFIVVYCHIFRGLYYGSYIKPRTYLWCSGVVIFILMMAAGFLGYVLPWGQMSFWGATVITNLFSVIPFVGVSVVELLWGGFSVDNATLNRFFSLHFLIPFLIAGMAIIHLALLHQDGSSSPIGIDTKTDKITFYPYFYVKDLLSLIFLGILFSTFLFFAPNSLGHPDNYIEANPMVTPPHIVPEWYFLPFYAILRSIPNKMGGVIAMGGALVVLLMLPFFPNSRIQSSTFKPGFRVIYWLFIANFFILGWIGQKAVETPFIEVGQVATACYFFFFFVIIPMYTNFENIIISFFMTKVNKVL
jgi:ubiquinol-cytochrome c reductase cytochrome b subunit